MHQTCFTGETLVAAENGQKRIDEIEVGDKVWAYNVETGETELKEVLTVYVHDQTEILHLHTTVGDIDTTTNHPFYVLDRGWVAAGDLSAGDEIYLLDGTVAYVTGSELEQLSEIIKVYNLEVEDFNTYFVGDEAVLVHNYPSNGKNSSLPVADKTTANNGLDYQSNPKHTKGQVGNNPNAGIEPRNSLELFEKSVSGSDAHRYTYDSESGILHRFFSDASGQLWHWCGSTGDPNNPLRGDQIPIDVKRLFNLPKKGW